MLPPFSKMLLATAVSLTLSAVTVAQTGTGPGPDSAVGDTMRGDMGYNPTYPDEFEVDTADDAETQPGDAVTDAAKSGQRDGDTMIYESAKSASERRDRYKNGAEGTSTSDRPEARSEGSESEIREQKERSDDHSFNSSGPSWSTTKHAMAAGWLEGKLTAALLSNHQLAASDIKVVVQGERAILRGQVATEAQKRLAADITGRLQGVGSVSNELAVLAPAPDSAEARSITQYIADLSTTAAIRSRLADQLQVTGVDIAVATFANEVTLSGTVPSDQQSQLAEQLARDAQRVKQVVNNLTVAS